MVCRRWQMLRRAASRWRHYTSGGPYGCDPRDFLIHKKSGCHFKNIWVCPKLRHTAKFEWFNHQELHCFWVQILGMPQVDALCHRRRTWQAFHKHWQSVRHRHLQQEANANWWGIGGEQSKKGVKLGYTNVLICLECTHMFTCFIMSLSYQSLSFKTIFF